ncbi:MAG: MBL fold metallo-hydrolase [Anaerolineae bacterium]|nr:MBL fold metallo-hydrolase [Anaerolineae bacterium]
MPETTLTQVGDHTYWMTPGTPDRPSLCAVAGPGKTLMLDAAASVAHMRLFLDAIAAAGVASPNYIALTHWHWDHVFGAEVLPVPLIAHADTAAALKTLAGYDWSDAALDGRVATGEEIAFCADNIKIELPEPRQITITLPDVVFHERLELRLGGDVACQIQHVGGDHAADSCVVYIQPDRVLFLGDCLYPAIYAPAYYYTTRRLFPLLDALSAFDADVYIEGHGGEAMNKAEFQALAAKLRLVGTLVDRIGPDEAAVLAAYQAQTGQVPDDDAREMVTEFVTGLGAEG